MTWTMRKVMVLMMILYYRNGDSRQYGDDSQSDNVAVRAVDDDGDDAFVAGAAVKGGFWP